MLKELDAEQHLDNIKFIKTQEVRDIYRYMIGHAACLPDYLCHTNDTKPKRVFQYHNALNYDDQPFAFIVNQKWLLFYFRKLGDGRFDQNTIGNRFTDANAVNGMMTIRIESMARAKEVLDLAFEINSR